MTKPLLLALAFFLIVSSLACAQEVAYAYGESGGRPLESGNITEYNGTDMVTSAIAGGGGGSALQGTGMTVDEMKREIALKLNVPNQVVDDKAGSLVLDYPGDRTINQICSIYEHMVGKWSYKSDTRGLEVFQYSNQSLEKGEGRFSGQGDCDDFAILLASLVESVGGTSRIVLAYGPKGGHAYTEVYLGEAGSTESDVQRMLSWLRKNFKVKDINTHTDLKTGDVWLNLDWWKEKDPNTGKDLAKHPGGPFFKATSQVPIPTREGIPLQPLKPVNEPPEVLFTISPEMPVVGQNASFDASKSRDIGGRIEAYEWDFGDGHKSGKMTQPIISHIYSKGGRYTVTLTLEDDEGAANSSSRDIIVNNPPQADFAIMPPNPKVGDQVKFDASESLDTEDGSSLQYYWEIDNGSAIFRTVSPPKLPFDEPGMYWVNLTVTDKNGAEGHKIVLLKINQPPIPRISFDNTSLNLGKAVEFSAGASEDPDGKIVGYAWDFGDNSKVDHNKTAQHIYDEGGKKTVRLTLEDNEGARSDISQEIFINKPPIASFSIDPAEPKKGEPVSFNASASSDPDGKIERFLWDFGVGKAEPEVYYSEFAEHTYSRLQKYNVTLTVEDDKGAKGSFSQFVEVKDMNSKPILINLHPDIKSPQEIGSAVTWTAVAFDEESDQLEFLFSLDRAIVQDWSQNSSWNWIADRDGMHVIEAKVRDSKHDANGDSFRSAAFEIILPPLRNYAPVLADLSPDKESPQVIGTTVAWTASASDAENDPLQFQFTLDGNVVQDWSESPTWSWTADQVGTHTIEVKAKDAGHPEGTAPQSSSFEIVLPPNHAPVLSSLQPDKESPQETGTAVTWTALASDVESDPISYRFLLNDTPVSEWRPEGLWIWTASEPGTSTISVQVRDSQHEGAQGGAGNLNLEFTIVAPAPVMEGEVVPVTAENFPTIEPANETEAAKTEPVAVNQIPVLNSLTADLFSPQIPGSSITWTADASDAENDSLSYRFYLSSQGTGGEWQMASDWSASNFWTQKTTISDAGENQIKVQIRDGKHAAEDSYDSEAVALFTISELLLNISGMAYQDKNGNNILDDGESLAGWTIDLTKPDGSELSALTGSDGAYRFEQLKAGSYKVAQDTPSGWSVEPTGGSYDVDLQGADVTDRNFVNKLSAFSISGMKYNDLDGNSINDGEPGMEGWTIKLSGTTLGNQAVKKDTATGADGSYKFEGLSPGTYTVSEVEESGWTRTAPAEGFYTVSLYDADVTGKDFGNHGSWSISGRVFLDSNGNGARDAEESGRAGWSIQLSRDGAVINATTTAEDGSYAFKNLAPGQYTLSQAAQEGWKTSLPAEGSYSVNLVDAVGSGKDFGTCKDLSLAGPVDSDVDKTVLTSVNQKPQVDILFSDRLAPQYIGSWIRWTAMARDPEGDPLQFKFYLRGPATRGFWMDQTGWGNSNRWTWRTDPWDVGISEVLVAVRDGKHAGPSGSDDYATAAYSIIMLNRPPTITGLASNVMGPQPIGVAVRWQASATDPEGNPVYFRYWLNGPATRGVWKMVRDWSTDPNWIWFTSPADAGVSHIQVQVMDGLHTSSMGWDDDAGALFTVLRPNQPPALLSLKPDRASPQSAGTLVRWTAMASDPDREPIYFKFWLKGPATGNAWKVVQDWSVKNQWTWTSTGYDGGAYSVYVYARDGKHNPDKSYDSALGASFTLSPNQPPKVTALTPDKKSPQSAGTVVTWTAKATDANKDPILYRFWLKGPATGEVWKVMQDWSANSKWTWTSSGYDAGNYAVYVYVRDGRHKPETSYDSAIGASYQLTPNAPPRLTALAPDKKSPQNAGGVIRWTASAIDVDKDPILYQFWLRGPATGGAWKVVQDWSAKSQWIWTSAPIDGGMYRVYVFARDGRHALPNAYDSAMGEDHTLQQT